MTQDILESKENKAPGKDKSPDDKGNCFSAIAARLFFFLLLIADILWAAYTIVFFALALTLNGVTFCKVAPLKKLAAIRWLCVKRSLVCALSLLVTLVSPAFGVMVACTYFIMYDKEGIDEVVPASLQDQFKEFFKSSPSI